MTRAKGLETCRHHGPSTIDHRTLQRSGPLPLAFLRGVGLPDNLIDYLPSLLNQPIQFYSCFISYSSKDQEFAERLHADLQAKGVRCWFAPHDMPIGAKILRRHRRGDPAAGQGAAGAVRGRDRQRLGRGRGDAQPWTRSASASSSCCSRSASTTPCWRPSEAWARLLRGQRNIGDFTRWKDHDAYSKGLERLLRDLKVAQAEP